MRLLASLGARETTPPLQVFMTTHAPVALGELSGSQLFVARRLANGHAVLNVGATGDVQSTIRLYPDAFLAPSVIVCEGASEVGLLRGLDQHRTANGKASISALGTALVDCGGGDSDRPFWRANALLSLGYRAAVLRDDDKEPTAAVEEGFVANGGKVVAWRNGRALEDELFLSLSHDGVGKLLVRATELHGEDLVNDHIKSATSGTKDLATIMAEGRAGTLQPESRSALGAAARTRRAGWYKSVTWMEEVARDIVGPDLANADTAFRDSVESVFAWSADVST